jgi:ATP-dependent helicase HrpA
MAGLPLDPRISRMIIEGDKLGALREVTVIAAVLAIQDPRIRPADKIEKAEAAHRKFNQPGSDVITFVNIWDSCKNAMQGKHPAAGLRKFCKTNFCSWQRMREWFDIHDQILRILKQHKGFNINTKPAQPAAIHQALTAGFLRNIGMHKKKNSYQVSGNREVILFPGSGLYNRGPQWIVAADFVHTSQLFARVVASIDVSWLEQLGGDLCKRSWSDPHWRKKAGQVTALEKVSLFGLILTAGRRVNYGRINTKTGREAREIFIHQALINGELGGSYPFLQHNLDLANRFADMEERLRRRGIMMDDQVLYDFYDKRLANVYDRFTLNRFLKKKKSDRFLWMDEEDICRTLPDSDELYRFPTVLQTGQGTLKLHYHFQPGHEEDGVTVDVPVQYYPALSSGQFEWLVPGLLEEKIFSLLKGLPKRLRKLFVPLPIAVDRIMDGLNLYQGSLYPALEQIIFRRYQVTINRQDWQVDNLPVHLRMRFRLCDERGKTVHCSRSFHDLANYCIPSVSPALTKQQSKLPEKSDITVWEFSAAPQPIPRMDRQKRITSMYYPALFIDEQKQSLTLKYIADIEQAHLKNRIGLRYLYGLQFPREIKAFKKECKAAVAGHSASWISLGMQATAAEIKNMLADCILDGLFHTSSGELPDREQVDNTVGELKQLGILKAVHKYLDQILDLLATRRQVQITLTQCLQRVAKSKSYDKKRFDEYQGLVEELLPSDFLTTIGLNELTDKKRYLQALALRIERAEYSPLKDSQKARRLQPALTRLLQLDKRKKLSIACRKEIALYRRMVEEFRVSVFAAELGTAFPVSKKRLEQQWNKLEDSCRTME